MGTTAYTPTIAERVLLAAYELDRTGKTTFTAADLAVAAWTADYETFGLAGYEGQHLDSNKVSAAVMGARGLVQGRKWLAKAGPKLYALTPEGHIRVAALRGEPEQAAPAGPSVRLSRATAASLLHLLDGAAAVKWESGRKDEITSASAWAWWGIVPGDSVDCCLQATASFLRDMEADLATADGVLSDGRQVSAGDVRVLAHLDGYMRGRFAAQLGLLRARSANGKAKG